MPSHFYVNKPIYPALSKKVFSQTYLLSFWGWKIGDRSVFTGYGFSVHVLYFNVIKHQFIMCVLYISFSLKGLLIFCSFFYWLYYWLPRFLYKIAICCDISYCHLYFDLVFGVYAMCFSPLISYPSGLPDSLYHKAGLYGLCHKSSLTSWLLVLIQWKEIQSRKRELAFISEGPSVFCFGQKLSFHLFSFSVSPTLRL